MRRAQTSKTHWTHTLCALTYPICCLAPATLRELPLCAFCDLASSTRAADGCTQQSLCTFDERMLGRVAQGQVSAWINTTFPPQEGQHTFHNGGRASTGSPYFAR